MNKIFTVDSKDVEIYGDSIMITLPINSDIEANDIDSFDVDFVIDGKKHTLTVIDVIPGEDIINVACISYGKDFVL